MSKLNDLLKAMALIETDRKISQDIVVEALKEAMAKAYKKHVELPDINVKVDVTPKGSIDIYQLYNVVDEVEDDELEISLEDAKKNLIEVPIAGTTIPHEFIGTFGAASVLLKPAEVGSGLIAGGSVRPILELAGYRDIRTKVIGTNNPRNVGYATINALENMSTAEEIAKKRGKKVNEVV